MIRNYFKIALRNLWRHKSFSLINIIGLAVGMAACFLIFMYVKFELSYDKFNKNYNNVYRLVTDIKAPDQIFHWSSASAPMGVNVQADFPEVKAMARIFGTSYLVQNGTARFQENNIDYADASIFKIFTFPFLQGNPETALKLPYSIVLTESTAKKYFGNKEALGKTLLLNGKQPATVTGVVKDVPDNAHFNFDMLISQSTMEKLKIFDPNEWGNFNNFTYLLLPQGYNGALLQDKLPAFLRRHISEDMRRKGRNYALFVEPLNAVYMDSTRGAQVNGDMNNVYIFSIIAVFILLIACINFVNLTTARASERAKEVGIRKVVGAGKNQLTVQFLSESIIISFVAFLFAVIISYLLLPLFNQLSGKTISHSIFEHGYVLTLFAMSIIIGFIAGIYPALVLTSFKITSVLKGRFHSSIKGIVLRKGLVVVQFTISIVLIVGTIIVYNQLNFMRSQSLGFKKDQMMVVDFSGDSTVQSNYESIKTQLKEIPGVISVSASANTPGSGAPMAYTQVEGRTGSLQELNVNLYDVDYDFIPQYGIKVIAGRTFSTSYPTDSTKALIINEAAVKTMGYLSANDAIGKHFIQWGRDGKIIGVIQDFHYESLQQIVKPLSLRIRPKSVSVFTLKIAGGEIPRTIASVQDKWKVLVPQMPFSYSFLDANFNNLYQSEDRFGKLFLYFAVLAILISCLGLLGLASYSTLQRTREIGVRKVLGATVPMIVNMLSKEFLILVVVAAALAFPLSWLGMHAWLQDFAYRIDIGWWVFVTAGTIAFAITLLTVSYQSIKAALTNPVKSLRSE